MATDYEEIQSVLDEIGALVGESNIEFFDDDLNPCTAEFWHVLPPQNKGLILLRYLDDRIGLYQLVGKDGDEVGKDIEFLRSLIAEAV